MARNTKKPEITAKVRGGGNDYYELSHDAFGTIELGVIRGGRHTLFGSDVDHNQRVRIAIRRARIDRHLSRDWVHSLTNLPLIEIEMSHSQFAEFITSSQRSGVPCTLRYVNGHEVPGIDPIESKAETFRREIKEKADKRVAGIHAAVADLEALLDGKTLSKTQVREIAKRLRNSAGTLGSGLAFVVESAEEALEKVVTSAKIEVEAYVDHASRRAGLASLAGDEKLIEFNQGGSDE